MIAFARASRNAISTSLSPSGTQRHFLTKSMSLSTKAEISATSLGKQRSRSMHGRLACEQQSLVNLSVETCSDVGRKFVPAHVPLAYRLFFGRFILNDVPKLHKDSVLNAHNICGNPIHRSTATAKSPVHDHEVSLSHGRSPFVLQRWRKALDEIEQTFTTRPDMSAVLNVVRRPGSLCGRVIALVEEC